MYKFSLFFVAMLVSSIALADAVWIDVRTIEEHKKNGIEGDILIPHKEVVSKVEALFPDKSAALVLYCRSGRRSGIAMAALKEAGYTNVTNAGGIADAKKVRGLEQEEACVKC